MIENHEKVYGTAPRRDQRAVADDDLVAAPTPMAPGSMAEMVATFGHLATGDEPPTLPFRAAWVPTVHDEDDR